MRGVVPDVVEGHVRRGFEAVRDAFEANFARRGELGARAAPTIAARESSISGAVCATRRATSPRDTMVVVHSATKGLVAMTLAIAHSRGWLDDEERVAKYCPEFAQHGKDGITVRQPLAHQAGLFAFDEQRVYARNLEVPSGNAVGTARAIARAYSVFASGGRELGLRRETLDLLAAPARPPTRGFYDECMKADGAQFSERVA